MITETPLDKILMRTAGWMLAALWIVPLAYALWSAFHPAAFEARFDLTAPLTLENFVTAWGKAPFARYFLNTIFLVTMVLTMQLVLCTLAAFAFARLEFPGKSLLFGLVLVQLLIMPDILLVENYRTMFRLGLVDTILAIGLPYFASGFAIFLLRQTFRTIPKELDEAARVEGCSLLGLLWRVYVPLGKPAMLAFGLVSVSHHWNNFLWPLVITNSVGDAAADGGPVDLRHHRQRHRMGGDQCGDADDVGAIAARLSAFPTPVRAEFHARGHQVKDMS